MTIAQAVRPQNAGRVVSAFGEARTIREWASEAPVSVSVLRKRLQSFVPEVALRLPPLSHACPDADPGGPGSWTWELLRFEDDPWAQAFVDAHPDGATLDEIGSALGLVREGVRKIEEVALRKFRDAARAMGVDLDELLAAWREQEEARVHDHFQARVSARRSEIADP